MSWAWKYSFKKSAQSDSLGINFAPEITLLLIGKKKFLWFLEKTSRRKCQGLWCYKYKFRKLYLIGFDQSKLFYKNIIICTDFEALSVKMLKDCEIKISSCFTGLKIKPNQNLLWIFNMYLTRTEASLEFSTKIALPKETSMIYSRMSAQ